MLLSLNYFLALCITSVWCVPRAIAKALFESMVKLFYAETTKCAILHQLNSQTAARAELSTRGSTENHLSTNRGLTGNRREVTMATVERLRQVNYFTCLEMSTAEAVVCE